MKRIVYEVERVQSHHKDRADTSEWVSEKRVMALKLINNASALSDAVSVVKNAIGQDAGSELSDAVAKIDGVIEELKLEFKKNYIL